MISDRRISASPLLILVSAATLLAVWTALQTGGSAAENRLIVYCAHDAVYAEEILTAFERQTGIRVDVRFDTEATKSLGLVQQIVLEKNSPRCDVFWNNELLGTVELQQQGLLEPYRGSAWNRLPDQYKDPEGAWVGFGARLRVYVINPVQMPPSEAAITAALESNDLSSGAIARPMFGTTLTQYSLLWRKWGPETLKAWHHELRDRGIVEVAGNAMVKNLVAAGTCEWGFTDTDDVFVAKDDGYDLAMLPIRVNGKTISIPNTAAMVRGTRHRAAAEKLIDYLASAETELALAKSKSRQVPLGPVDASQLPDEVRPLVEWVKDGADLSNLLPARRACLDWLRHR